MECFAHHGAQAVGVCKACGKAVCRECGISTDVSIACSQACSKEAADLHEMNQRGKKIYGIGVPKKMPSGVIMWMLFALLFGGFGAYYTYLRGEPEWFLLLFGAASLVIGVIAYRRAKEVGLQC